MTESDCYEVVVKLEFWVIVIEKLRGSSRRVHHSTPKNPAKKTQKNKKKHRKTQKKQKSRKTQNTHLVYNCLEVICKRVHV